MTITETISPAASTTDGVLQRLRELCMERGLDALSANISLLQEVVVDDLGRLERELGAMKVGDRAAHRAASDLVHSGGKRLRPLCVALASRVGQGFDRRALDLAVAVELVHNATLLHDDVIDLAPTRRGAPAARAELGNAASIFAGDWLLVEALKRVQSAGISGLLEELLETIASMIRGESLQLENRRRLDLDRSLYLEIAENKSATLFRWAMLAGAKAGEAKEVECRALAQYGTELGIAFQIIDDLLDLTGERQSTGKALFADLREGKMTLPLILALESDPALRTALEEAMIVSPDEHRPWSTSPAVVGRSDHNRGINHGVEMEADQALAHGDLPPELRRRVTDALAATGAERASRDLARERVRRAQESLEPLSASEAKTALLVIAESTVRRSH